MSHSSQQSPDPAGKRFVDALAVASNLSPGTIDKGGERATDPWYRH